MAERSEAVEERAVRDASAVYSVEAEITTSEDVPPGYKRTEVGVIPEDWEFKQLCEVTQIRSGIAKNSSAQVQDPMRVHYLRVANVQDGYLDLSEMSQITISRSDLARFSVQPGDVLMNEGGDRDKLGRGAIWRGQYQPCIHQNHVFVVRPKKAVDPEYLSFWSAGDHARKYFLIAGRQTTNLASINKTSLGQLPVVLPAASEQRAIATALSDVDALLQALDRLIAKKRAIKKATMQQLLTGQTRLPGFTGEWKTKRLGDVGTFYKGQGIRRDDVSDEGVSCIRYGEIYTRYGDCVLTPESRIPEGVAEAAFPLRTGDILFAGSGETAEEIGMCVAYLGEQPAFAGGDIVVLRPNEGVSAYLGRLLNHPTIAQQKARQGQGDAVVHISARNLAQIEVHLPDQKEQAAIASILSGMDTEIEALGYRRDKARQIKQGMMQQLLTGRVRLVEPESSKEATA